MICVKANHVVMGKMHCDPKEEGYSFRIETEGLPSVMVHVLPSGESGETSIESKGNFDVSVDTLTFLQSGANGKEPADTVQDELSQITLHISQATCRVISAFKYCLKQREIAEDLIGSKGSYWSVDGAHWEWLPRKLTISSTLHGLRSLNDDSANMIQEYLANGPEPFVALKFLHRAMTERNPRYKWIDATIAAELAIKEFLIRLKPEIETLLLEVPSPPLRKLYGAVLESLIGQRSPKVNELSEGAEIRNQLVHRPQSVRVISQQEAFDYVKDVEAAIGHLVNFLYPDYYRKGFFVDHYSP